MSATEESTKRIEIERLRLVAIHNEQTKLSATYANGCAIALFAIGGLTPALAGYASAVKTTVSVSTSRSFASRCASPLHMGARLLLRGVKS